MGVSKNSGTPNSSHFNRVFHYKIYKPSILGYHYFWKHPNRPLMKWLLRLGTVLFKRWFTCCFSKNPSRNSFFILLKPVTTTTKYSYWLSLGTCDLFPKMPFWGWKNVWVKQLSLEVRWTSYCWWQPEIRQTHQLIWKFIPLFTVFFFHPTGGWPWDFWTINLVKL